MTRTLTSWFRPTVIYALVVLFLLWTVAPVAWIATMSVQPEINYISVPPHLHWQDTSFRWFSTILKDPAYTNALRTSFIVSTATMIVCLVLGSLAAYPLARLKLPFKNAFLVFTVATRMVPAIVLIIPMFLLIRNLHLLDTYAALIVVYSTFLLPYVIWMLKNFFEQIPYSLEAAARMDGCSRLGALFRVIIPVSASGVVATAIFAFIGAWNEFLFGLILSNKVAIPITVRLSGLVGGTFHTDNSLVAATGMLAIAPVVALVFILNRFIVRGLVEGVKY
jgi:multiple sugar transport system permease protein